MNSISDNGCGCGKLRHSNPIQIVRSMNQTNNSAMENIKKAQERLVKAIVAMHPELCMGDKKQEELYMAMHNLSDKINCDTKCESKNTPTSSEQFATPAVSNQRELLLAFIRWVKSNDRYLIDGDTSIIDDFLSHQ